jgi:hypothetical protein
MKKIGNYVISTSLLFSVAVFGASLMDKAGIANPVNAYSTMVDVMGNVIGH